VARWLLRMLLSLAPAGLPRLDLVGASVAPLVVSATLILGAVVLFGSAPAIMAARSDVASAIRVDGRSGTESRQRRSARHIFVALQVAMSVVILMGAGLLARSLAHLQGLDLGYSREHLSIIQFSL